MAKRKSETWWCVVNECPIDGPKLMPETARRAMAECMDDFLEDAYAKDWEQLREEGYRCVKIKVQEA